TPLLDEIVLDGSVRNDAPLDQKLPTAAAAGFQPSLVQTKQVAIGRAGCPLADLGQHIDKADDLFRQLAKHGRQRVAVDPTERVVGATADGNVIVHVDQLAPQGI